MLDALEETTACVLAAKRCICVVSVQQTSCRVDAKTKARIELGHHSLLVLQPQAADGTCAQRFSAADVLQPTVPLKYVLLPN